MIQTQLLKSVFLVVLVLGLGWAGCRKEEQRPQPPPQSAGQVWQAFAALPPGNGASVELATAQSSYRVGEEIRLTVETDTAGQLWLIAVDQQDQPVLVYPNVHQLDNAFSPDQTISLPPDGAAWQFTAQAPAGETLLLAVVTPPGEVIEGLSVESAESLTRLPDLLPFVSRWGAASRVVDVQP